MQTETACDMMKMNFTSTWLIDRDDEFRILGGTRDFLLTKTVQTGSDAHPVFYSMGAGALPPRVKRPEREVDRSPLPSRSITLLPLYVFMAWTGTILTFHP